MLDFSKNYFELLGLPDCYSVDLNQLSENYRELQQVVHPDRFANSSEQEKRLSMQSAVLINEAFETLKKPLSRARYMLEMKGEDLASGTSNHDPMFLMEQIELREQLESVRDQDDAYAALDELMAGIDEKIKSLVEEITPLVDSSEKENLEQAAGIYRKMQFLSKLQHDAEALEEELDETL